VRRSLFALLVFIGGCASSAPDPEAPAAPEMTKEVAAALARPPGSHTPDEVYSKLISIADESAQKQPRNKNDKEFIVKLPSEKPRTDDKTEWMASTVSVFYPDQESVNRITLETETCNVTLAKLDQDELKIRVQRLTGLVTKTLFVAPFLLQDKYFKSLGPDWQQTVRVPIKEDYTPVVDMRLIREVSKCDGRNGYKFRLDFFMK